MAKGQTGIWVDKELVVLAKAAGIVISHVCEKAIEEALAQIDGKKLDAAIEAQKERLEEIEGYKKRFLERRSRR
jgi:post-segregation antitoxin (ccd killing protein)